MSFVDLDVAHGVNEARTNGSNGSDERGLLIGVARDRLHAVTMMPRAQRGST
jgi:hypothetical protein